MEDSKKTTEAQKESGTPEQNAKPAPKKKVGKRIRSFFADFKTFIAKGNIINLAVAVVIGAAFGAVVTAFVNGFIMPLLSLAVGKGGLEALKLQLGNSGAYILWGEFLQKVIDFLIIAFFIFLALRLLVNAQKGISKTQKKWLKKIKKHPELAENPPEELKEEVDKAMQAEESQKIESTEDILKDIRKLLTAIGKSAGTEKPEAEANTEQDSKDAAEV